MSNPPTTAVIFDLGRVLLTFDHERCYEALATLTRTSSALVRETIESEIRPRFDRGKMSIDEVHSLLEMRLGATLVREDFVRAWADVFEPIPGMISWLHSLHGRVRLALLSNTDAIHLPWCVEQFGFFHNFEQLFLSYEVGKAKPDPAIFHTALERLKLPPSACYYIDDIAEYANAARSVGMTAVHHRVPAETQSTVEEWIAARGKV
jgi:glucose-1-phosphatase